MRSGWARAMLLAAAATLLGAAAPPMSAYEPLHLPPASDGGVRARYMGASTLLIEDGETQILIDGFFSRPSWLAMAFGTMRPRPKRIDYALDRAQATNLAAVLVAHAHHDHALDAPDVAARSPRTLIIGSPSVGMIAKGRDFPAERVAPPETPRQFGDFKVRALRAIHSPSPLPASDITEPVGRAAWIGRYAMGQNYAYVIERGDLQILVYPAAHPPPEPIEGLQPDVIFLSVGKLGDQDEAFADDYWRQVVLATQAPLVVPIHWDDFTRPLDRGLVPLGWPFDNARRGLQMILSRACGSGVEVRFAPLFEAVDLSPGRPQLQGGESTPSDRMAPLCAQVPPWSPDGATGAAASR